MKSKCPFMKTPAGAHWQILYNTYRKTLWVSVQWKTKLLTRGCQLYVELSKGSVREGKV